jgi:ribosomal protein L37AE/L43A
MTPKIIELIIEDDDDQGGLDGIALVEMPAHEADFEYFSNAEKPTHYVLSDDEIPKVVQMFHAYGEPQGLLEKEGWFIHSIRPTNKKEFQILANPNAPSSQDTDEVRFRYKYVGPKDDKNRTFCAEMMSAGRVFRIEDIIEMSNRDVNPVGPDGYDIFEWRGSFNCRHKWVQLIYRKEGRIINSDRVERGVIDEDGMPGPDTRTTDTIAAGNTPPRRGFSSSNPDVSALPVYVDEVDGDLVRKPVLASLPLFEKREDAEALALVMGCKGSHPMTYGNKTLYMPCDKHSEDMSEDEIVCEKCGWKWRISEGGSDIYKCNKCGYNNQFGLEDACWEGYEPIGLKDDGSPNCVPIKEEMNDAGEYIIGEYDSFDDYPELIRKNAQAALNWIEKTGNPRGCMTQVGKVRAQQLAQGKPISLETVKRMKAYITRHKKDLTTSKSYEDGCGKLAMDAWGGVEALPWIESTIKKYEEMSADDTSFQVFNNEQRLVVGPAMIPDKMIIRRNEITGEIYYVYFTAETIKKLQQKFMQERLLDKTNIEHGRKFLTGVDVVESWIVDDQKLDKQQVFGMDYPKGTWMISMKVNNDDTWNKVKDGKLKGFSVQGYFMEKAKFSSVSDEILQEIKQILKDVK